jgi:hypothetical protein
VDEVVGGNPVEDELWVTDLEELEPVELDCKEDELDGETWVLFELEETCLDDVELSTTVLLEEETELIDPVSVPVELVDFVIELEGMARELLLG